MMKIIIFFAFFIFLLSACNSVFQETEVLSGAGIYKSRCISCHGADGRMGMNGARKLPDSSLNSQQRIEVVKNGRNIMPAFNSLLSEAQIIAVAQYTMTLK
jgi:cytochrome c6